MKGRHQATGRPQPEDARIRDGHGADGDGDGDGDARRGGGLPKKLALWTGLALCIAFIAWVAWGVVQFDHDIEHPREGGFSGWQCDPDRPCNP